MVWGIEPEIVGIPDNNPCGMGQLEDNPCGMGQPEELMNNGEQTEEQVAVRMQRLESRESHKCG